MQPVTSQSRVTLSPDVERQVFDPGPEGELVRLWLRYLKALAMEEGFHLDDVVAPDVRCIDLELAGWPCNLAGLRDFRDRLAILLPDPDIHVLHVVTRPEQSAVEAVIRYTGHRQWDVRTIARFKNGRMIERWDRSTLPPSLSEIHPTR